MACRRGLKSLGAFIYSFSSKLPIPFSSSCSSSSSSSSMQQLATPLTSLRHIMSWQRQGSGSILQPAGTLRRFSAAAAVEQQAAPGPQESLEEVRERIFGTHIGNGLRSGRKVLSRKLLGPTLVAYYPEDISKKDPFMLDLQAERAKLKLDRLKRRGKAPPKKGSGKRAGKKK